MADVIVIIAGFVTLGIGFAIEDMLRRRRERL